MRKLVTNHLRLIESLPVADAYAYGLSTEKQASCVWDFALGESPLRYAELAPIYR